MVDGLAGEGEDHGARMRRDARGSVVARRGERTTRSFVVGVVRSGGRESRVGGVGGGERGARAGVEGVRVSVDEGLEVGRTADVMVVEEDLRDRRAVGQGLHVAPARRMGREGHLDVRDAAARERRLGGATVRARGKGEHQDATHGE